MTWKSATFAAALLFAGLVPAAAGEGPGRDYFEWADAHGLVGIFADPEADLDRDGITNLMAYAFDLAPVNDPDAWDKLPTLAFVGDPPEPMMTFVLPAEIPRDVSYVVDMITDEGKRVEIARKDGRGPWQGTGDISKRKLDNGCTEVTVLIPLDLSVPEGGKPLRLKVEFAP